jgi:hypothetical protein
MTITPLPQVAGFDAPIRGGFWAPTDSRRLAEFLVRYGRSMNADQYEFVQCRHYGRTLRSGETMLDWVRYLDDALESSDDASFKLPMTRQMKLWPDLPEHWD